MPINSLNVFVDHFDHFRFKELAGWGGSASHAPTAVLDKSVVVCPFSLLACLLPLLEMHGKRV